MSPGLDLHVHDWTVAKPRLTLALLHGYAEHGGRYAHVAAALNAVDISVVAVDLRGHGRSPGPRGVIRRFRDYHEDVDFLLRAARERRNGSPMALFGHSLGGLIATHWLLANEGADLRGVVLSSPFLDTAGGLSRPLQMLVSTLSVVLPGYQFKQALKGEDVARDPQLALQYDSDPLIHHGVRARWLAEALGAGREVMLRAAELDLATLLIYGAEDRIASVDALDAFAKRLGARDLTSLKLRDCYHEVVNEPEPQRTEYIARISSWLLARSNHRTT